MFDSQAGAVGEVFGVRTPTGPAPARAAADCGIAPGEDVFGRPLTDGPTRPGAEQAAAEQAAAEQAAAEQAAGRVLSLAMRALVGAVDAVLAVRPVELPGPQALADTAELLRQIERLRAGLLARVADVEQRKLHLIDDAASTSSWVDQQHSSLDRGQVALARRIGALPLLAAAVWDGQLSITVGARVATALSKLRRHVDRPDGRIDGQDGEQALLGVIGDGVRTVVCQAWGGLADDDVRLHALLAEAAAIAASPTCQLARLEAAFVLVARQVEPHLLPAALGMLLDALLPNQLEKKAQDGHDNRGFGIGLNSDGSGWHLTEAELDLECGELLHTLLTSEMAIDPDNPTDTAGFEQLRTDGWQPTDELPTDELPTDELPTDELPGCGGPRSLRQRRHDALKNGLRRFLDAGITGQRDKIAPHIAVTVGLDTLHGAPGSLPTVGASGARLPASLVRRWLCDSAISRFVLSLGGKVIETSHTERTLKPHERRAKRIETGGRCQAAGCHHRPGAPLVPHHASPWAACGSTSLSDTVLLCATSHHDLHTGNNTLRLKDGRRLNHHGWVQPEGRAP